MLKKSSKQIPSRHRLIRQHLNLVTKTAKKYKNQGIALADLEKEGKRGLLKACMRYSGHSKVGFKNFALRWIEQHILRAIHRYQHKSRGWMLGRNKLSFDMETLLKELGSSLPEMNPGIIFSRTTVKH